MAIHSWEFGLIALVFVIGRIYRSYLIWQSGIQYLTPYEREKFFEGPKPPISQSKFRKLRLQKKDQEMQHAARFVIH